MDLSQSFATGMGGKMETVPFLLLGIKIAK